MRAVASLSTSASALAAGQDSTAINQSVVRLKWGCGGRALGGGGGESDLPFT